MTIRRLLFVSSLGLLLSTSYAMALLNAYEGFDYGFRDNLNGQTPSGSGFTGNWVVTNQDDEGPTDDFFEARGTGENFNYGSLTENGRAIRKQSGGDSTHAFMAASVQISDTSIFADNSTVWLSFLSDWSSGNMAVALGDSSFEANSKNNARLVSGNGLGVFLDNNDGGGSGSLGIEAALFDQTAVTGQQSDSKVDPIGTDVLYLVEYTFTATDDTVTVYQVDTSGNATMAGSYVASIDQTSFDTLTFLSGSAVVFDEFRIGTDSADVAPGMTLTFVPEPSTYALLAGMLAFGSIALRRRK